MSTVYSDDEIAYLSAIEIAERVRQGELSIVDTAELLIGRIERLNPNLNAIVDVDVDQIRGDAKRLQGEAEAGSLRGPLHGVPYTIKGLTSVAGRELNFGMKIMQGQIATEDAAIVRRLRDAGGLFLGITNTPESGYYGGTDNNLHGRTKNPWKPSHTSGGSSGGAAAAVGAGLGPLAEGSDGAGSIRIPAALSGVVGFKPSTGLIPQAMFPGRFNNWLFHGPITRNVPDAALMLDAVKGQHPSDPMSLPNDSREFSAAVAPRDLSGLRIAFSPDLGLGHYTDEPTTRCVAEAAEVFSSLGAKVTVDSPDWGGDPEEAMWHGVWMPAFAALVDSYDWPSLRGQVDDNLIEIIDTASRLTAVETAQADVVRAGMWATFSSFMSAYDVVITPTLSSVAFPGNQFAPAWLTDSPLSSQVLGWINTYPFNMLNNPAISVPAGFSEDGLPIGLQIAGMVHTDASVLSAAAQYERATPWHKRRPQLEA